MTLSASWAGLSVLLARLIAPSLLGRGFSRHLVCPNFFLSTCTHHMHHIILQRPNRTQDILYCSKVARVVYTSIFCNITLYRYSLVFWHLDLKHIIYTRSQASEIHMLPVYIFVPPSTLSLFIIWVQELQRSYTPWEIYWRLSDVLSKDKQKGGGNCATRKYWDYATS